MSFYGVFSVDDDDHHKFRAIFSNCMEATNYINDLRKGIGEDISIRLDDIKLGKFSENKCNKCGSLYDLYCRNCTASEVIQYITQIEEIKKDMINFKNDIKGLSYDKLIDRFNELTDKYSNK